MIVGNRPRVAVVVDWLAQFGGAELVVKEILAAFPEAELFALFDVMAPADRARLSPKPATTSWLQRIPGIRQRYRSLLPLMPRAIRSLDLRGYDLIISSHHSVAKGVRKRPGQIHVCYCHSPTRYLWDLRDQYLEDHHIRGARAVAARWLLDRVRAFDLATATDVDRFIVNSRYVADRVARHYGRESIVVHPPVDIAFFTAEGPRVQDLYVTASRQVPQKKVDRVIDAFRRLPERRLVVLGDGPQHGALRAMAADAPNIELRGEVSRDELRSWLRSARAFVFAADEDFGIAPLEAQACGTPVLALAKGGSLETVLGGEGPDRTGLHFADDRAETISATVQRFEALASPPTGSACRTYAERFEPARFRAQLAAVVTDALSARAGA